MEQSMQNQIPPELDIYSESFDPVRALNSHIPLPYPQAKTYNNLAEYHSRFFLKKDNLKKAEKSKVYDRDYSFYYNTLGMNEQARKRYENRKIFRKRKYMGWRTAKMRKYHINPGDDQNREFCKSFPPLKSTKIIQLDSPYSKYKIIPLLHQSKASDKSNVETLSKSACDDTSSVLETNLNPDIFTDSAQQSEETIQNKSIPQKVD